MKKTVKFAMASVIVIGTAAVTFFGYNQVKNRKVTLPEGFTVTAHTGCENTVDNSLEAIKKGYESGADIVEFDLNFTDEGKAVLSHDQVEGDCVTVEEAFSLVAQLPGLKVNVDCKSVTNLKVVGELSEKYGISDRIFYTGIEQEDVAAVKEQTPDVSYWLNYDVDRNKNTDEEYLLFLAEKVAELGAVGLNISHKSCTEELVEVFHREGLLVSIWTVNNEFDMIRAVELGVDNITTRKPVKLGNIVEIKTNN